MKQSHSLRNNEKNKEAGENFGLTDQKLRKIKIEHRRSEDLCVRVSVEMCLDKISV